ncbi:hypothetical protein M1N44_03785, partial [Dehalococcoidia bacterium]|nr:hypothetical protein [Dehalococcoidia bacterium]
MRQLRELGVEDPEVEAARERFLYRETWQPASGYMSIDGAAEEVGLSRRWIWGSLRQLGITPTHDGRHAVLPIRQVEELVEYRKRRESPKFLTLIFDDGATKIRSSLAAKESGYTTRWINQLVSTG